MNKILVEDKDKNSVSSVGTKYWPKKMTNTYTQIHIHGIFSVQNIEF